MDCRRFEGILGSKKTAEKRVSRSLLEIIRIGIGVIKGIVVIIGIRRLWVNCFKHIQSSMGNNIK